jgi:hypothetical protein
VRVEVIVADRDNLGIEVEKLLVVRPKGGQLTSSATGEVAWVESDDDLLPSETA